MRAKKKFGQNFLIDTNIIEKIITAINSNESDLIIEIGPGMGALTKRLKEKLSNIIAYEVDTDLKEYLSNLEDDKTKIIYQDFLTSNINVDISNIQYNKLYIVGNLPYYITTPIIEHIIKSNLKIEKLVIMVQKEVADRFLALPKTKEYGYITVLLQYYFNIKRICNVSKNSFNPIPKVESTVLEFNSKEQKEDIKIDEYQEFLKQIFKQKRKTLKNNIDKEKFEKIKPIIEKYKFNENVRAEEISETILREMYKKLID